MERCPFCGGIEFSGSAIGSRYEVTCVACGKVVEESSTDDFELDEIDEETFINELFDGEEEVDEDGECESCKL